MGHPGTPDVSDPEPSLSLKVAHREMGRELRPCPADWPHTGVSDCRRMSPTHWDTAFDLLLLDCLDFMLVFKNVCKSETPLLIKRVRVF